MLKDNFGRVHDYLRISLTDVCNFRCQYCILHENTSFMPSSKLMMVDEIDAITREFVKKGKTLILTLPGSTKGAQESMDALLPFLLHLFRVVEGKQHF